MSTFAAVAMTGLALAFAAAALAAHPKHGKKYVGCTSEPSINGFCAPVDFRVSESGHKALAFTFGSLTDCNGSGGFGPGDPWKGNSLHDIGAVAVNGHGAFSALRVKQVYKSNGGFKIVVYWTVRGKFKTAKQAVGSIRRQETDSQPGSPPATCHTSEAFSATAK